MMRPRTKSKKFRGFTLAELIVVISILAILATVGFLALSGYSQDAKDSAAKANVRSVYSAIVAESAVTGNSPRYYVVHDPSYALSGGIVAIDGNPSVLTGGDWNQAGTNYSAGNPDYAKLKLAKEKFKVSELLKIPFFGNPANAAADPAYLLVGASDFTTTVSWKTRTVGYVQVAGVTPTKISVVVWNYPKAVSGSVSWLIRDPLNGSMTGAMVDGYSTGPAPWCPATTQSGYSVPALASGWTANSLKTVLNGTGTLVSACSHGTLSFVESGVCSMGYWWGGWACGATVNGVCGTASGSASVGYPASGLCAPWTAASVDTAGSDGHFDWNCLGSYNGTSMTCSAPVSQAKTFTFNYYMGGNTYDTTAQRKLVGGRTAANGDLYLTDFVDSCCSYASGTQESFVCSKAAAESSNGCWFYAPSGWAYGYTNYGAYWRAQIVGNTLSIWTCGLWSCWTSWTAATSANGTSAWATVTAN